ncbi:MAG: heparinase II/III family protein [Bacteroidia bacterium]|nr:heparinase II/III family protein [Bacteroidia bacterium]
MRKKTHLFLFFLICITLFHAFDLKADKQVTYPLTGHPRLYLTTADEAVLKAKIEATPNLLKVQNAIVAECEKIITLPVQQRILTGARLLSVSREALRRISFLSFAYRMTNDTRFATRGETEMLAMAAFSDWHPAHFLDVAEMTMGMAIGYDWLYNWLGATSRSTIATAIKQKGVEQTSGANANQWWMTGTNNWNQVCNAGISAGVAAVYDENPTYYQTFIDRAVNSIKLPMAAYKNNGAFPEGYGYWDYGTSFNVLFIDLLNTMWGTDSGLSAMTGFLQTGNYISHIQGNATKQLSGGTLKSINPLPFNFADCGASSSMLVAAYWLAAHSENPAFISNEWNKLDFALTNKDSNVPNNRLLPFLLIWSKDLTLTNLPLPTETTYVGQGEGAVAALRSGWGANEIYLGIKGGTPSASHAHMDIGSFVMEANDVRWAIDFGMSDYNTLETNGVDLWNSGQTSERWDVFRLNNLAHNTLTINGNKQLVTGNSQIQNVINTTETKSVDVNLTSLYKNDLSSCIRTGSILSNRYVEIKDVITTAAKPLTIRWNLLTQAVPQKVSDKIIRLTQSTKALYLVFEGTETVTAKTWSTTPSTTYEERNTDTFLTGFEYTLPAGISKTITVKLVPAGDPILTGLDLSMLGKELNENFEAFQKGSLFSEFVSWKTNPASNSLLKAVLGEVVANPFKSGINRSENVLKITRQDDSDYITTTNAGNLTYRGVQAYGYDLRVNTNSVVEFSYYKDVPGRLGVRIYDGSGNMLLQDFTDMNESIAGFNTAQWRTAQFEVGKLDLSKFSFTPSGYLLISPERNGTEAFQEKEIVLYVDDVKLLPLKNTSVVDPSNTQRTNAFFDAQTRNIYVSDFSKTAGTIRLYNWMRQLLQTRNKEGDKAVFHIPDRTDKILIIQSINTNGDMEIFKLSIPGNTH